ncbi:hypothetical protein BSKO_08202 [Bryopsis sp. KO-2023]|nr:hypothetical protein BSKO_08202 [Bryopsis sp. KO-2023]
MTQGVEFFESGEAAEDGDWDATEQASDISRVDGNENFKVVVRVRPPLLRELQGFTPYQHTAFVDPSCKNIIASENLEGVVQPDCGVNQSHSNGFLYATYRFTFDHVYNETSSQDEVYMKSAKDSVLSVLEGYNAAIIAYGQTGTGKTYTMEGATEGVHRGIIPRAVEDVFAQIQNDPEPTSKFLVRASYLQIYNENISDLLKEDRSNLVIREDPKRGVFVDGLSEWVVRSAAEVYGLMARGAKLRATGTTKLNEISSRSHAILIIIVEKSTGLFSSQEQDMPDVPWSGMSQEQPRRVKVGKLNLVDLAGSERVHVTGATGRRLEESKKINQSLSALGNVIAALTDQRPRSHIPYRNSKLTRILEDSIGGNCKTTMIAMISPALEAFAESVSTLKFANRAKRIKNEAHVNEDVDQRTLLRKYEKELKKLRSELHQRSRDLVDKRRLLEVEDQKRRAERDKLAAISALEERSREFMQEKKEKEKLEKKINGMQSQLLVGGQKLEELPVFRTLLAREHRRIRGEYEARLKELEKERQTVEADKAQVDRYKKLLLKQRDIMIALTARLNERDEQIITLQEELEVLEKHQRQLEDGLDQKTAELIKLRKAAVEQTANSPSQYMSLRSALGDWANNNGMSRSETPVSTIGDITEAGDNSTAQGFRGHMKILESDMATKSDIQFLRDSQRKEREAIKTILNKKVREKIDELKIGMEKGSPQAEAPSHLLRAVYDLEKLISSTTDAIRNLERS